MSVFLPVTKFVFCNRYNNHSVNSQVPWRKREKSVESWREIFPSFFSGKQATWHGPIFQWKTFFDLWKRGRGRKPTTRKMIISFGVPWKTADASMNAVFQEKNVLREFQWRPNPFLTNCCWGAICPPNSHSSPQAAKPLVFWPGKV